MEINANQEQGIQVMSLVGSFDTASAAETEPEFIEQIGDGSGKFLIDFSEVPYIASSGLRILLKMAQAIKVGGGRIISLFTQQHRSRSLRNIRLRHDTRCGR